MPKITKNASITVMMQGETKKKILYVITKGNWGGAQRYVFDLATNLPKDTYEPLVVLGTGETLNQKLQEKNIKTIIIPSLVRDINFFKDFESLKALIKIFKEEKPEIIHLNSSKIGLFGVIAGRIARIPKIIFIAHGWAFNENRSIFSKLILKIIQWLTVVLSHTTIAVSEKTKKDLARWPLVNKKMVVVYNGIDIKQNFIDKKDARFYIENIQKIGGSFWFGTASELHANKGLDILINGFEKITDAFPEARLIIMGEGEEKNNLNTLIEKNNLKNKVFLLGRVNEASKYFKAFDVFTLTSRTEALPYVILEAGLAQKAVIASHVGGIPEIIEDRFSGILVPKENSERVADAMAIYLRDANAIEKHSKNLQTKIIENFSIQRMLDETLKTY